MNRDQFFKMLQQGVTVGSTGYAEDKDRTLKELLQGRSEAHDLKKQKAEQDFKQAELDREAQRAQEMYGKNPKAAIRYGDVTINPESDPLRGLLFPLTPAQEAAEKTAGKQIADWEASGGRPAMDKNIQSLKEAQSELGGVDATGKPAEAKRDLYDQYVGGALSGFPSIMGMVAPSEKARRDKVRNTALTIAKQTDPNPTEKQIEAIMGQVYDPSSDNDANRERVDRFLKEQQEKAANMEAAAQNYDRTGYATIGGVRPKTSAVSPQGTQQKAVAKRQYSPSRNQTKLIYSDGSEEIVNGRQ